MAARSNAVWSNVPKQFNAVSEPRIEVASPSPSEITLVELAKRGNREAFDVLISHHYQYCIAKACSILRNREDAEDEVQNALTLAWTRLWQCQTEGSFGGWLSRIVCNQCLIRFRSRKGKKLTSVDDVTSSYGTFRLEVVDQRALPEDELGERQMSEVVMKEIQKVPRLLREALVMRDVNQLGMRAVAGQLGITIPAAKSRLMRARLELRQRLLLHLGEQGSGALAPNTRRARVAFVKVC